MLRRLIVDRPHHLFLHSDPDELGFAWIDLTCHV